jgi:hypothetical protein
MIKSTRNPGLRGVSQVSKHRSSVHMRPTAPSKRDLIPPSLTLELSKLLKTRGSSAPRGVVARPPVVATTKPPLPAVEQTSLSTSANHLAANTGNQSFAAEIALAIGGMLLLTQSVSGLNISSPEQFETMYEHAREQGRVRKFHQAGLPDFEYAVVSREDFPGMVRIGTPSLVFRGRIFVMEDFFTGTTHHDQDQDVATRAVEYLALHEYARAQGLSHELATACELELARSNGDLDAYFSFIGRRWPTRMFDLYPFKGVAKIRESLAATTSLTELGIEGSSAQDVKLADDQRNRADSTRLRAYAKEFPTKKSLGPLKTLYKDLIPTLANPSRQKPNLDEHEYIHFTYQVLGYLETALAEASLQISHGENGHAERAALDDVFMTHIAAIEDLFALDILNADRIQAGFIDEELAKLRNRFFGVDPVDDNTCLAVSSSYEEIRRVHNLLNVAVSEYQSTEPVHRSTTSERRRLEVLQWAHAAIDCGQFTSVPQALIALDELTTLADKAHALWSEITTNEFPPTAKHWDFYPELIAVEVRRHVATLWQQLGDEAALLPVGLIESWVERFTTASDSSLVQNITAFATAYRANPQAYLDSPQTSPLYFMERQVADEYNTEGRYTPEDLASEKVLAWHVAREFPDLNAALDHLMANVRSGLFPQQMAVGILARLWHDHPAFSPVPRAHAIAYGHVQREFALTPEQMHTLVSQRIFRAPFLVHWLQDLTTDTADIILQAFGHPCKPFTDDFSTQEARQYYAMARLYGTRPVPSDPYADATTADFNQGIRLLGLSTMTEHSTSGWNDGLHSLDEALRVLDEMQAVGETIEELAFNPQSFHHRPYEDIAQSSDKPGPASLVQDRIENQIFKDMLTVVSRHIPLADINPEDAAQRALVDNVEHAARDILLRYLAHGPLRDQMTASDRLVDSRDVLAVMQAIHLGETEYNPRHLKELGTAHRLLLTVANDEDPRSPRLIMVELALSCFASHGSDKWQRQATEIVNHEHAIDQAVRIINGELILDEILALDPNVQRVVADELHGFVLQRDRNNITFSAANAYRTLQAIAVANPEHEAQIAVWLFTALPIYVRNGVANASEEVSAMAQLTVQAGTDEQKSQIGRACLRSLMNITSEEAVSAIVQILAIILADFENETVYTELVNQLEELLQDTSIEDDDIAQLASNLFGHALSSPEQLPDHRQFIAQIFFLQVLPQISLQPNNFKAIFTPRLRPFILAYYDHLLMQPAAIMNTELQALAIGINRLRVHDTHRSYPFTLLSGDGLKRIRTRKHNSSGAPNDLLKRYLTNRIS